MNTLRKAHFSLRSLFRGRQLDAEMDEEMRFHLEMAMKANIAAGMVAEEAREAALHKFGSIDKIKQLARAGRGMPPSKTSSPDTGLGNHIKMCLSVLAVACLPLGILWDTSW